MPIYMDIHDMPDGVTAAHVAEMHQADLKIEHKYSCRGLTYWCDERRQTAFCLMEAPNEQAVIDLHKKAHGDIPQRIIEVNKTIVESFLGRIEDPEKSQDTTLNIINDPAFRTLMVVDMKRTRLRMERLETLNGALQGYSKSIANIISAQNGRIVKQSTLSFLTSFSCVTKAVESAIEIQELYNKVITPDLEFNIGISAGIPVTENEHIFENTIRDAQNLSAIKHRKIAITPEVKGLYESENQNNPFKLGGTTALKQSEMEFIRQLISYTETIFSHSNTSINDFHNHLGLSKSKLYRIMMTLIGKSPNNFLKSYRLDKALQMLDKKNLTISEIAYSCGFSSPTYFSKCFYSVYGVLPSHYAKRIVT